jgi:hypothetical protein
MGRRRDSGDEFGLRDRCQGEGGKTTVGEAIYASSGDFGPAPLTAIDVGTGKIKWQERAFPKASFVVVDEDGGVSLATFSPAGAKVISKFNLLEHNAWTAPTLAGTKLYVRDRKSIAALEVGR